MNDGRKSANVIDILLPRTDAGVAVQLIVAAVLFIAALVRFWRNRDARIFIVGLWVITFSFMGVRAIH
jgi:hypothetical protein